MPNIMSKIRYVLWVLLLSPALFNAASGQCKMTDDELIPIVDRFNPFFTDHSWDNLKKIETVRLDPYRLLVIKQKACIRHHVLFTLYLDPGVIEDNDKFWITEALVMFKRVHFNQMEYHSFKKDFEVAFIKNFLGTGVGRMFNFPVNERTFICKVERGDWGAKIKIETVRFIITEKIKRPGISRDEDDAYFISKD